MNKINILFESINKNIYIFQFLMNIIIAKYGLIN